MKRKVGHKTGVARYHQLYTLLRSALDDGTFTAGNALPSETGLARRYNVSRNTVRRALARLNDEQRVVSVRGSGTYVRAAADPTIAAQAVVTALADPQAIGERTQARWLRFHRTATPTSILKRWPDFGARSIAMQRRRFYGEECFVVATSYVPEAVGRGLTRLNIGHKTIIDALVELGVKAVSGERSVTAMAADAEVARQLALPVGAPVLLVETLVRDERLRAIEYQRSFFRPDRYRVTLPLSYAANSASLGCRSGVAAQSICCG